LQWREQKPTRKNRYSKVLEDMQQMVGFRNMLCGMHVHVEVPDPSRRVEIMYRTLPHLHLFLALSTSSPFCRRFRVCPSLSSHPPRVATGRFPK
jgi:carboxylate-amine ligase